MMLDLWSEVDDHCLFRHPGPASGTIKEKTIFLTVRFFHISKILLQTFFLNLDKAFVSVFCIVYVFKNVQKNV